MSKTASWKRLKNFLSPLYLGSLEESQNLKTGRPSESQFGELQVAKNAINLAASFAVHLPTGAITGTFEFLHSCEDIAQFNPFG